jgi:repressor LexA
VIGQRRSGELTPIQCEILEAIRRLTQDHGHPPCMREVLTNVSLVSPGALSYQYGRLEAKGYIRREAGRPRTVEARLPGEPAFPSEAGEPERQAEHAETGPGPGDRAGPGGHARPDEVVWVPVVGRVAAGDPVLAEQSAGDYLPLPKTVVGGEDGLFILEVVGDSMIGVGIFSGDWVVVRPLFRAPRDGDIVAATIDGLEVEGTVKTYKRVGRQIWLMPQNPAYTPIHGGKAKVAGKVIAVLRQV